MAIKWAPPSDEELAARGITPATQDEAVAKPSGRPPKKKAASK